LITDPDFFGAARLREQGRGHEADHAGSEAAQDIDKRWHRLPLSFAADGYHLQSIAGAGNPRERRGSTVKFSARD
jgi:hypothetical protein